MMESRNFEEIESQKSDTGEEKRVCQKCGNQVTDREVFCSKCGTKLIDDNTTSQEIESSDGQASVAAENTQAVPQNAVKAGKLQKLAQCGIALMCIALALLFLSSFIRIPISSVILGFGAVLGLFLSALDIKKPLKFSKIVKLIFTGVVMVVYVVLMLALGGGNDKYIRMVKSGTLDAYPQKTVGDAFDGYLANPKWESGVSEDGVRFVNVKGKILYYDKEANLVVQFIIENEKTERFSYNACEINGVPQDIFFYWGLLEVIYNGDSVSEVPTTENYYLTPDDEFTYLVDTLGESRYDASVSMAEQEPIESYYELAGQYGSMGQSTLSLSIYSSQEEGETAIGKIWIYLENGQNYEGEVFPIGMDNYQVAVGTGEDILLIASGTSGNIMMQLYVDGQYVDEFWMVEQYVS